MFFFIILSSKEKTERWIGKYLSPEKPENSYDTAYTTWSADTSRRLDDIFFYLYAYLNTILFV